MPSDNFYDKWLEQEPKPAPRPRKAQQPGISPSDDVEEVTQRIEAAGIDITADYGDWVKLGFALSEEYGENGRDYFHRLSRFYPDYDEAECDRQYDKCLRSHGTGVTIRSFYQLAKDHGISVSIPSLPSQPSIPSQPESVEDMPDFSQVQADGTDGNDGSDGSERLLMPTFYSAVKGTLPRFLERIADVSDSDADADMLILGSLAVISACLPSISGIYAKRHIFPNMYLFVTARAGTGKGRLYLCKSLVEPIHDELRAQAEIEEEKYRQDKEIYKRQKRGEGIPEPTPPPIRLLFLPANSSSTAIYQALNENGEQGLMFETEGDTLASTFGQDFGDFSDGLRKAFHHESISYLRRTQREYVNIKKPRLSTVLSGTPQQVVNLMSSVENGLFSRFLFYYLDKKTEWIDVLDEGDGEPLDEFFEKLGKEYLAFFHTLQELPEIKFQMTPEQGVAFNKHFALLQADYVGLFGDDTVASVRRLATSTYRIAMILSALRIWEDGDTESPRICSDEDYQTAMAISEVLQQHMLRVIKELPSSTSKVATGQAKEPLLLKAFWDALPEEFEAKDFKATAQEVGLSMPTAERYIRQWVDTRLDKVSRGRYRKR